MNAPVRQWLEFEPVKGTLILYEPRNSAAHREQNLVLVNANGAIIWIAELPKNTGPDCFLSVKVENGAVVANTWSCYALTLDISSGKILEQVFTK